MSTLLRARRALARRLDPTKRAAAPPRPARPQPPGPKSKLRVQYHVDEFFDSVVTRAAELSQTEAPYLPPSGQRERVYTLTQLVRATAGVPGLIAECGVFRGLTAYSICAYVAQETPGFRGAGFHVFDSFEGLSPLTDEDRPDDPAIPVGGRPRQAGMFAATLDEVRAALSDYPEITFHQGWIPEVLNEAPDEAYRLVHVDLDVHAPTRDSIEFFYPKLSPGGALICDDYGFIRWPGAFEAVETFCRDNGAWLLRLTTGQAIILRPAA